MCDYPAGRPQRPGLYHPAVHALVWRRPASRRRQPGWSF